MMKRSRVFLSYAREDGEVVARKLFDRLEGPRHDVWMDRFDMSGGRDWWLQITAAIEDSDHLILLVTPSALESSVVAREWRHARQQGVCVLPVRTTSDLDYRAMPKWLSAMHHVDSGDLDALLGHLGSECRTERVPFMAAELPRGHVVRQRELDELKTRLLDERRNAVATTLAVEGSGGYGKTTLALALCHDDEVLAAFHHGVLWVTLGRTPDLRLELDKLHRAVTGQPSNALDLEDAARELGKGLRDRRVLLVIDDVWRRNDLRWFLQGGDGCARIVTTRLFDIAQLATPDGDARLVVDEMTDIEAVRMFTTVLEDEPSDLAPFLALVERLGHWPLLVNLARGVIRDHLDRRATVANAIRHVDSALDRHGLVAFDATDPDERNDAAAASVGVALELLTQELRDKWVELVVFPEDTPIPLATVGQLWGLELSAGREMATRYDDLSLLHLDLEGDTIEIHDVLLGVAQRGVMDHTPLHRRLLTRWGDLRFLPVSDAYAWQWAGHHLIGAAWQARLRGLLLDPLWILMKMTAAGLPSLLADYERLSEDDEVRLVGRAVRLSGGVLNQDAAQLAGQLHGRLSPSMGPGITRLLEESGAAAVGPWLKPQSASLASPMEPLVRTLSGHIRYPSCVAVTPDGRHIVTAGDWTVEVFDAVTGVELHHLDIHSGSVRGVAVTPDGKLGLSWSDDSTVKVWDLLTGTEQLSLRRHTDAVLRVAVTPDGQYARTASADGTVGTWDLEDGGEVTVLDTHGVVRAMSADGSRAVSFSTNELNICDLEHGVVEVHAVHGELSKVEDTGYTSYGDIVEIAMSFDGRTAIVLHRGGLIVVWDLESVSIADVIRAGMWDFPVQHVALSPDGLRVLAARSSEVWVWDLKSRSLVGVFDDPQTVGRVSVTPDGRCAVTLGNDGAVRLWDLAAVSQPEPDEPDWWGLEEVTDLAATGDGRFAFGAAGHDVRVWELGGGTEWPPWRGRYGESVVNVAATADGQYTLTASHSGELRVLRTAEDIPLPLPYGADEFSLDGTGHSWALTPNRRRALTVSDGGVVNLWSLRRRKLIRTFDPKEIDAPRASATKKERRFASSGWHGRPMCHVAATNDGNRVLCVLSDGTLDVWDLKSGAVIRTMDGLLCNDDERSFSRPDVRAVSFTPDGRYAISASHGWGLWLWDVETGAQIHGLDGHDGEVRDVTFTPDALYGVSAGADWTLRLWDLDSGAELTRFTADGPLNSCLVTDDNRILTAGASGRLHILTLERSSDAANNQTRLETIHDA